MFIVSVCDCSATIDIGQRNKKDWEIECVQADNGPEFTTRFVRGLTEKSTLFQTTASKLGIHHKLIKPYTPRHNGKEERIHREAHNKFYSCHSFSSCGDLNQQLKDHLVRSDNRPMRHLGRLSHVEFFFLLSCPESLTNLPRCVDIYFIAAAAASLSKCITYEIILIIH